MVAVNTPGTARNDNRFSQLLAQHGVQLQRRTTTTLQINVGKRCNMACQHCHVDAGPKRDEMMSDAVIDRLLTVLDRSASIDTVDLTGGAPELHPRFRDLVQALAQRKKHVIDRCNLTVALEPDQETLLAFLAEHRVHIVASLPCYTERNVDAQRGRFAFAKSIRVLQALNALGYGQPNTGLLLDLVYNPGGAFLPGAQRQLEADYRTRLLSDHGIVFGGLLTLTNMPIARFDDSLVRLGKRDAYLDLLVDRFSPATLPHVMCTSLVSVSHTGELFDCDFHQMMEMPLGTGLSVFDIDCFSDIKNTPIHAREHCLGCTAGEGSSCGGALVPQTG